jgi:hypothetical protein
MNINERRHKVLAALVFFMVIRCVVGVVATLQQLALQQHNVVMTLMFAINFLEHQLFVSYTVYMFRQHIRLLLETFEYLCGVLAPSLSPLHKCVRSSILLRDQVAISLNRLSSGNSLHGCGELYGIAQSTVSIIVKEFCAVVE